MYRGGWGGGGWGGWHRFRTHIFYYRFPDKIYVAHIPVLLMHMARKGSTQSISTNFDRPKPSCTVLIVENHAGRRQLFWSNRLHWHWHWHCCDQIDCTGKKPSVLVHQDEGSWPAQLFKIDSTSRFFVTDKYTNTHPGTQRQIKPETWDMTRTVQNSTKHHTSYLSQPSQPLVV